MVCLVVEMMKKSRTCFNRCDFGKCFLDLKGCVLNLLIHLQPL